MKKENTPPEVAIIGSGYGFKEILPALLDIGYVKIKLMKPRDYSESKYKSFEHPSVSFATLEEIACEKSVKIVFVAMPPFLQSEYVKYLAPFRKSIYLEKPGGLNARDASDIHSIVQEFNINLYIGFHLRFDPIFQMSKKLVNGFSGQKRNTAKIKWNIKKSSTPESWKQDVKKGGGVHRDHLCHMVDLLRNSFGFSDDSFGQTLNLYSENQNFIDQVNLKSESVEIEINRGFTLESSLEVVIQGLRDQITIESGYPFNLGSYSIFQNNERIDLPRSLDLNLDARSYALKNYVAHVLAKEFGMDSGSFDIKYPSIEDAIFTQGIADLAKIK
jgi:predicted dehydrogenase